MPKKNIDKLGRKGALTATISAFVSCAIYLFIELSPFDTPKYHPEFIWTNLEWLFIAIIIAWVTCFIPSTLGGYFLGLLMQRIYKKTRYDSLLSILIGMLFGAIAAILIFGLLDILLLCTGSHGYCQEHTLQFIINILTREGLSDIERHRILSAIIIALIAGGWTGLILNKLQKNINK